MTPGPYDGLMTTIDGTTLDGVSATTLWTLHGRGTEAKRSDGVIRDPWAVTLLDTIDYDYLKFGKPNQSFGLRALAFDTVTGRYLTAHPKASVVALAEGLQTSFWRLDRTGVLAESTWYSIDLPPVMELRRQLLPDDDRIVELGQSALDRSWMDRVDATNGVFITAEGLLMYLEPEESLGLIADCAARFPGGQMMFDSLPRWFTSRTLKGFTLSERYQVPVMPFGQSTDEALAIAGAVDGVRAAHDIAWPPGRGLFKIAAAPVLEPGRSTAPQPSQHHAAGVRMTRYVAFLRGVNVGGVNLKMAEVAAALTDAGFTDVTTVLASGNVLLTSTAKVATVRRNAEKALRDAFDYDAWVLAYEVDAVRAVSDGFPFEREVEGHHSYVTFVTDAEVLDELVELSGEAGPDERIERGEGVVYWQVPKTGTLDTTIGRTMGKKRYKSSTTTRNLRTIEKVLTK